MILTSVLHLTRTVGLPKGGVYGSPVSLEDRVPKETSEYVSDTHTRVGSSRIYTYRDVCWELVTPDPQSLIYEDGGQETSLLRLHVRCINGSPWSHLYSGSEVTE